jgi:hypothetical protein
LTRTRALLPLHAVHDPPSAEHQIVSPLGLADEAPFLVFSDDPITHELGRFVLAAIGGPFIAAASTAKPSLPASCGRSPLPGARSATLREMR